MVGDIDHLDDLRDSRFDRHLDALPERDIDLGATLAAAAQLDVRDTSANLEQVDNATMRGDRGVDLPIEHLLDASRNRVAPAFARVFDPQGSAQRRGIEIDDRPFEVGGATRLDQQTKRTRLYHDVGGWCVLGRDEIQLVDELAGPAARDRNPQAGVQMATSRADGLDFRGGRRRDRDGRRHWRHSIRGQLRAMARILLLIPSRTYRTHDFMTAASRLDIEVVVGSEHRPALAGLMDGRHLRLDFEDVSGSTERIVAFAQARPLAAVVAVDDAGTLLAAAAAEALGLPHNPVDAVEAARDKARMRERFAAAGLPTPQFATADIDADPKSVAAAVRYPCIVKPLDLSGSQGVVKVDTAENFPEVFARVAAIVAACRPKGMGRSLLIEDFIPGDEVAVEALLRGGELELLAIFDKPDPLNGPFFEETIYVTPSRLPSDRQRQIIATTARAAGALGLTDGPIHAQLRLNDAGIWMLEVAARSIGGLCSRTLRFGSGISLEELILRHAAGLPMPSHPRELAAAGVMMLPIRDRGRLRSVQGQTEAKQVPGVEGLVITIPPGEALVPLPEGDRYLGFIFARAGSPDAVEAALRRAHGQLRVVTDG